MPSKAFLMVGAIISLLGAAAPGASAVNYSSPATYTGTAATGGTVEFDVSGDSVSRFAVSGVATTCGAVSSTTTGSIPIVNEAFSFGPSGTGLRFDGTFPAAQRAQGTLSFRLNVFPVSCTSDSVSWTATTPTPPRDDTAPKTSIKSGPSGTTKSGNATFRFKSNEGGSTFQCKLDRKAWSSCRSPKTYRKVKPGKHTFKVKARDKAGNVDSTPAKRTWRVS